MILSSTPNGTAEDEKEGDCGVLVEKSSSVHLSALPVASLAVSPDPLLINASVSLVFVYVASGCKADRAMLHKCDFIHILPSVCVCVYWGGGSHIPRHCGKDIR